eukprot:CAMPEP_0184483506 /NCGR_PEP_ID=MMETSP0113_2-20130426/5163_1 /TAXON_ID=91329 /ORGANISM="Norrisiella sphaerica, Strain BC52" /LENGTH=397 /DNA_ID=CAMNT_0026863959 /DNA_START=161 /DNA_END=1354 /DNA_ORIENTATION=+
MTTNRTLTGIELTEEQYKQFQAFKKELKIPEKGVPQDSGVQDDTTLYRFLSGKKWNMEVALKQYKDMLKWRTEMKVDSIAKWYEENKEKCDKIQSMYPSEHYGFDKYGRPLLVHRIGAVPAAAFAKAIDIEDFKKYHIYKFEQMMQLCRDQTKKLKKPIYNLSVIVDADGLGFHHRHYKPYFQANAKIDKQNYPEFLYTVKVINAPWVLPTIYSIVKHIIDPNTRDKIDFLSEDYKDVLEKEISPEQIPKAYKGLCEKKIPEAIVVEDDEGLDTESVMMMSSKEFTKHCNDPNGGKFVWLFKLEAYDIDFKVSFKATGSEDWVEVLNESKIEKHEGQYDVKGTGELKLTFDNSYSYMTSKTLKYMLALHSNSGNDEFGASTRKDSKSNIFPLKEQKA